MSVSFGLTDAVKGYLYAINPDEHPALARCRAVTAGLGDRARMQISPEQGAFMAFMTRLINARLAVEVGVFTGYSALATTLALRANAGPGARLFALDVSEEWTDIAKGFWQEAGVETSIDLRIAPATESLDALIVEGFTNKIDLMFIDADKPGYSDYFEKGVTLLRPGGLMLFDNVLWSGAVADEADQSPDTVALRAVAQQVRSDPRVESTVIAIGDGVLMVRKR
jgi:O-methyltransferase